MDVIEGAIPGPQIKIIIYGRAWRQILGNRAPLASGAEHIHQPVEHLAYLHMTLVTAPFGRRNMRFDISPFLIGKLTGIIDGGNVYQIIADDDISYHATNYQYNAVSIGIEIVGFAGNQNTISDTELRAAADLVRWMSATYTIPISRSS
jgi:hypothetical protein